MRIGFVGVGHIGEPMAAQLLAAGHELIVHDARPDAARDLLAAGARWASSPADVATRADVVATCLPGPAEMEQVCLGPRGLAEGMRPGALYIDHTTNSPLLVARVHRALGARGVHMLDAPVSGGMEGARTRDLLVMAGGDAAVFARARPVLDAVAKRVLYTGPIGSGSIAKIMHNCATFTLDLVMAECWTVAVKAGMAPDVIVDVFNQAWRASALTTLDDALIFGNRTRIIALTARHRLPAIYGYREFPDAGGLMAYGPNRYEMYRRAATYVDK